MTRKTQSTAKKEEAKPALVPKLRFPEFRGAEGWATNPLSEVCSKITQGGTPDTTNSEYWGGSICWITPAEMGKSDSPFLHESIRTITEQGLRNCASDLLPVNSVILSVRAPIGHLAINTVPMAINQGCKGLIGSSDLDYLFLYYSLLVAKPRLTDLGAGNTFKELSGSALKNFEIPVPPLPEQQKIAECLSSVDELIGAQARKVDALKTHKKGLMQNLFPREGETQPRLRFPEFQKAGGWEEQTVGDFGKVVTGSTPSTAQPAFYGGGIPFVSPADISDLRFVDQTKTTLTDEGFAETRPIRAGSVLFVCIGSTIGKVAQNVRDCATNQQINAVVPSSKHSDDFVYLALSFASERIALLAGRQAVPIINKSLFSSVRLLVPTLPEQHRIASCVSSLDALITAEAQKLEALKTHKRGLMQQLFPAPEVVGA